MSCFVLDPGGSREIGLCPHSRIYPETNHQQNNFFILNGLEYRKSRKHLTEIRDSRSVRKLYLKLTARGFYLKMEGFIEGFI
jgi:hypothetical protein